MTSLSQFYSLYVSVNAKLKRNSNFFQKLKIFLLKLKKISAQNSIILAKLNFSEIPFPYYGAKTAKKKPVLNVLLSLVHSNL